MMTLLIALLLSAAEPQEKGTATRTEKGEYNAALAKYKEAEPLVETDPAGAIDRFSEIISNPKIRVIECILRIEQRPAEYSDPYSFLPYQLRGTARVNLSKRQSGEAAQKTMALAIEDYTESVNRKVPPSAELLKTAQARLTKLKEDVGTPVTPAKADPLVKFREKYDPLIRDSRFKSAKALIEKEGLELSEDQRRTFTQNVDQLCKDFLVNVVADFRPRFLRAMGEGLESKTPDEFDLIFSLPAPAELTVTHPAVEWARQYVPAFRDVQSQKSPPHSLAAAAVAAAPLEERVENPWFRAIETAVTQSLRSAILAEVDHAKDAGKQDRDKARALADGYLKLWKDMTSKLDAKFIERHRFLASDEQKLTKLFEGFPSELAGLEKIDPALDAAFAAEAPDAELAKVEESLSSLESKGNLSRESRQRLYTARVTVVALRGLLAGRTEEAVAGDLSGYREKLRDAGGPVDEKKYGPRVEKIFAALR
jgi:hypothetical protein